MPLTQKRMAFVHEYLVDLNQTAAARRAGYSERTATEQASRMMARPDVQEAIAEAQAARAKRTEVTADRVVAELAKIAFADVRRLYGEGGALLPVARLDDDTAAAVVAVDEVEGGRKVKLADKLGALQQLGRHLGIGDRSRVEVSGPGGGPVQVQVPAADVLRQRLDAMAARAADADTDAGDG